VRYLDEFRDPDRAKRLIAEIRRTATRRWTLMEVCGGQTHSLLRHGIDDELADVIDMIHGPGCPVCVTRAEAIDLAIRLSLTPGVTLATFGDMLRVPGTSMTLNQARAAGGDVRAVYSPLDAIRIASNSPAQEVVFFAVGFETTAPATALAACQADRLGLERFSLLVEHVRVLPAMRLLVADPDCRIDAFLAAGHVCTITGFEAYDEFARHCRKPIAIAGFEPVDLLLAILHCVRELERNGHAVSNAYDRVVTHQGNASAQMLVDQLYQSCDRDWRGLGPIPEGGFELRDAYHHRCARHRLASIVTTDVVTMTTNVVSVTTNVVNNTTNVVTLPTEDRSRPAVAPTPTEKTSLPTVCIAGDVLTGRIKPPQCPAFGTTCRPEHPLGAPMVSSEGACAAYHRYAAP
jgi:hydrogenase expression/formation protein HypD